MNWYKMEEEDKIDKSEKGQILKLNVTLKNIYIFLHNSFKFEIM